MNKKHPFRVIQGQGQYTQRDRMIYRQLREKETIVEYVDPFDGSTQIGRIDVGLSIDRVPIYVDEEHSLFVTINDVRRVIAKGISDYARQYLARHYSHLNVV